MYALRFNIDLSIPNFNFKTLHSFVICNIDHRLGIDNVHPDCHMLLDLFSRDRNSFVIVTTANLLSNNLPTCRRDMSPELSKYISYL